MDGILSALLHLLWIVPLVLLFFFLASPRFRGDIAEARTRRILAAGLEKNRYTVFNNLLIPSGGGTTLIDHVVVSRFGIFVLESQYARGWVTGTEVQARWTQHHLHRSTRFDNPMHRNRLQQEALQNLFGIPASRFHPIVVMTGHKGFKAEQPEKVVEAEKLLAYMRKKAQPLLSGEQADQVLRKIDELKLKPTAGPRWGLYRLALFVLLLGGAYLAFQDDVDQWRAQWAQKAAVKSNPKNYHEDGSPKSERELWEDSLICAYSVDTGRCACYDPKGARANLSVDKCRDLAERGSILKQ
jgi:hypothetical protein